MPEVKREKSSLEYLAFFIFSIALLIMKLCFHELWKDEWQAWLIATDIPSLKDLFTFLPYEGHPSLWFLLLRSVNILRETALPFLSEASALQGIHLVLSVAAFYFLFIKFKAPFFLKILVGSGYFFFFEYSVINRSYVLMVLLILMLVVHTRDIRKNTWLLCLTIFLLTQTEVYGVFMGLGYCTYLFSRYRTEKTFSLKSLLSILTAFTAGIILFSFTLYPGEGPVPETAAGKHGFPDISIWVEAFRSLFFKTFIIGAPESGREPVLSVLISILLFLFVVYLFKRDKPVLWAYLSFLLACLSFYAAIYAGGPRQWGLHLVYIVALSGLLPENWLSSADLKFRPVVFAVALLILSAQVIHNVRIVVKEILYPFSNSREAAEYIKRSVSPESDIIGINKAYCTPVIGYAGRKFYSLPEKKEFSFFLWEQKMYVPSLYELQDFSAERKRGLYVISYRPLNLRSYYLLLPLASFDRGNIRDENYYIYKLLD
jgi:hypothetical protein